MKTFKWTLVLGIVLTSCGGARTSAKRFIVRDDDSVILGSSIPHDDNAATPSAHAHMKRLVFVIFYSYLYIVLP